MNGPYRNVLTALAKRGSPELSSLFIRSSTETVAQARITLASAPEAASRTRALSSFSACKIRSTTPVMSKSLADTTPFSLDAAHASARAPIASTNAARTPLDLSCSDRTSVLYTAAIPFPSSPPADFSHVAARNRNAARRHRASSFGLTLAHAARAYADAFPDNLSPNFSPSRISALNADAFANAVDFEVVAASNSSFAREYNDPPSVASYSAPSVIDARVADISPSGRTTHATSASSVARSARTASFLSRACSMSPAIASNLSRDFADADVEVDVCATPRARA